jgi:hypothetical protein
MVYLKDMLNRGQKCSKFRIRWRGPYEVFRRLSDLNYLVKLSRTKEIVVNVNKMKKCFRQTIVRPTIAQRSTRSRVEDKPDTLETYGTRYTRPDSHPPHSDSMERHMTEDLTQEQDRERHRLSRTRASSCGLPKYRRVEMLHLNTLLGTRQLNITGT